MTTAYPRTRIQPGCRDACNFWLSRSGAIMSMKTRKTKTREDNITTEEQLCRGIALAKAGKNPKARNILGQVVKSNPRSISGWLWLAGVVETKEQQCYCLERALQLGPQNKVVRQALAQAKSETGTGIKTAKPRVAASPQCSESMDFRSIY